ncbi:MAG TPA: PAS domain S-box protein, partial [Ktedonobacterales bacterium]
MGSPGKDRSRTVRPKVALRGGIARDHLADADHFMWSIPSSGLVDDVPAWRAFTGQEPLDVRGYGWLEAVASDERAGVKDVWVRAVATRALFDVTCRVLRHDGVYRDLTIHGMPLFDTHHRLRRWVGSCQDVTERKAQGQEQRERGAHTRPLPDEATLSRAYVSNESFSRLLESNIIGFGIVDTEQ